jgi:hypothetical protein
MAVVAAADAAANPTFAAQAKGVGYATSAQLTGAGSGVTVAYTLLGDNDLSGSVANADRNRVNANFLQPGEKVWFDGDFNYNGTVDNADRNAANRNFLRSLTGGPSLTSGTSRTARALALTGTVGPAALGDDVPDVTYNPDTGQLRLLVDQATINNFRLAIAQANIVSVVADPDPDDGVAFTSGYVDGEQNWGATNPTPAGVLTQGKDLLIATLKPGLGPLQFVQGNNADVFTYAGTGGQEFTTFVQFVPEPGAVGLAGLAAVGLLGRRRRRTAAR